MILIPTWKDLLFEEKRKPYFVNLLKTISKERESGIIIYPSKKDVFNAFRFTEFNTIKIVILGQDPYYGPNQANGLAFSVPPEIPVPPSLLNIYRELKRSIPNFIFPEFDHLRSWACQGVLLLNTVLTVRKGQANSHSNLGWKIFTNKIVDLINEYQNNVVFLLWGTYAQKVGEKLDHQRHCILKTSHPSPLSAHLGFLGCNHFILANQYLEKHGKSPIDWLSISTKNKKNKH